MKTEEETPKTKKKRVSPVIVPRHIKAWINANSTNSHVNSWKVGGGHSYNARNQ